MDEGRAKLKVSVNDLNTYLADESDPKLRALASLVYTVAKANADTARETTKAIVSMSGQLETHLEAFEKHTAEELENSAKSRGMRKLLTVLGICGNLVLGVMINAIIKDYNAMNQTIVTLKSELATTRETIDAINDRLDTKD